MAEFEVEGRPYFEILHTLIRHDDDPKALEQLSDAMEWMTDHRTQMAKVCSRDEWAVMCHLYAYWADHGRKNTPSRKALEDVIRTHEQPKSLLDILEQYDHHEEDLEVLPVGDLDTRLDLRIRDYEKFRMTRALSVASQITVSSWQATNREKTVYTGPRDAMTYLVGKFQEGILLRDQAVRGGSLDLTTSEIKGDYEIRELESKRNNLFIRTGIPAIDNHMGGLRRKEMNGILGYSGQRKSYIARTIAYFAARNGFRVLHIPFESDYKEEQDIYALFHSSLPIWTGKHRLTKKRLDGALLTPEEKTLFFDEIIPDYKARVAKNITVYEPGISRSWPDVQAIIERENYIQPVDLCIIDYLTLLRKPGARDEREDKIRIIQEAKALAMTANDNRGMCMLTPVQGSRKGYEEAGGNDGVWDKSGIFQYSEMEKTLDNCFYTYFNPQMNEDHVIKFGSCKTRRDKDIPVTPLSVDPLSGRVGVKGVAVNAAEIITRTANITGSLDPTAREITDLGEYD